MKKWLIGLACVAMGATMAMGQVATLPISESYAATQDWTALTGWSGVSMGTYADGRAQFNANNDSLTVNFDAAPGTLTFDIKGNTATTGTAPMQFVAEESADGSSWTQIVSIDETQINASSYTTFGPYTLDGGSRYVKWTYVNKYAFNVGLNNVYITSGGPAVFGVTVDKSDGFEVEEGSSGTITATAANGTEPYGYAWETTMSAGDYTAVGNVFTILDTAALGDFSATVTATDNDAAEAVKTVTFSVVEPAVGEGIVDFRFNDVPYLQVTAKDSNLTVSDMALTAGTIEAPISTGAYFPDMPYIEETGGWAATSQAEAKAFIFTITPAEGASVTINGFSFNAYSTAAGPSAFGFDINGVATHEVDAPSAGTTVTVVSQAVAGVVSQTTPITVKIQGWLNGSRTSSGAGIFRLDDVVVHGSVSTGPLEFSVSLDKANGFEVIEGSSETITATAANGTEPYSYEWVSTLAGTHYEAPANVFTILATAPIGDYTATVTVTDDDSDEAVNTISFSVVAPTPKYAIAITPPVNGSVTTTPATEAEAGQTVTINATPDGGYAVETITVVESDMTPVAVDGTTFTMPSDSVTVTVTFAEYEGGALIISQYYEGAGNNKWIEIYNPGGSAVDLEADGYRLGNWNNAIREDWKTGAAPTLAVPLVGTISAGGVHLVSHGSAVLPDYVVANQTAGMVFNGDDSIVLYTGETYAFANVVDAFGWAAASGAADRSFVRKDTITAGVNTDFNADDWDEFTNAEVDAAAPETNERLGYHSTVAAGPHLTYTGSTTGTVGVQMALDFTLHGAVADGWGWAVVNADRDPVAGADGTTHQVRWTPSAAGTYYLTVTAYDISVEVIASREVTLTVNPAGGGDPYVTITGDLTGTVGEQMDLLVQLFDGVKDEWWIDLRDPDNVPSFAYNWDEVTGEFSFTPSIDGTWNLSAWAVVGMDPIATTSQDLVVSAASANPPIPTVTMALDGTGDFTFVLPGGWVLVRVEGANTTLDVDNEYLWTTMNPGIDYTYDEGTGVIRILTDSLDTGETGRMLRLVLTPGQ